MFEMHRERHSYGSFRRDDHGEVVSAEIWVDADVMEHERGFRLICLEAARPGGSRFRYVKGDFDFDFFANRRHPGGTVTGTYSVSSDFRRGYMKWGGAPWLLERAKMEAIAADIAVGLRAWPPKQLEETTPIGVVHFWFLSATSDPYVRYEFAFGEPLILQDLPPSMRWVERIVPHCVGRNKDGTDKFRNCPSLLRDDGVQLIRIPTLRGPDDGPDTYHYIEADIVFDFTAERRFSIIIVTDTWEVRLDPPGRDGFSSAKRAKLGVARCAEIVRTIEEALYAWPAQQGSREPQVPVNRVVFLDAP